MPDPDSAPERPEPSSVPSDLPESDHRAIQAAVAGAAGLLLGRVIFGRAGGLAAGIAAVGAGLLARRKPVTPVPGTTDAGALPRAVEPGIAPESAGTAASGVVDAVPVMQVRLEAPSSAPVPAWLPVMLESRVAPPVLFQPAASEVAAGVEAVGNGLSLDASEEAVAVAPPESVTLSEEPLPLPVEAAVSSEVESSGPPVDPESAVPETEIVCVEAVDDAMASAVEAPVVPEVEGAPVPVAASEVAAALVSPELDEPDAFAEVPALFVPFPSDAPASGAQHPAEQTGEAAGDIVLPELTPDAPAEDSAVLESPVAEVSAVVVAAPLQTDPAEAVPAAAMVALPVEALIEKAAGALETEEFPADRAVAGLAKPPVATAPVLPVLGPLGDLPAEFVVQEAEEAPGPRDGFLIVPDDTRDQSSIPAIEPVIAALGGIAVPAVPDAVLASAKPLTAPVSLIPVTQAATQSEAAPAEPEIQESAGEQRFPVAVSLPGAATAPIQLLGPAAPDRTADRSPAAPSPFTPWQPPSEPSAVRPQTAPVRPQTAPVRPVPLTPAAGDAAPPPVLAPEPEEIWRQAAQEITASPFGEGPLQADARAASMAGYKPEDLPAWLRNIAAATPAADRVEHNPAAHKAFLPTIKLSVPQGPQPLSARRPVPVAPAEPAPVNLPGYKAEPLAATQSVPLPPEPVVPVAVPAPAPVVLPLPVVAPPAVAVTPEPMIDLEPELQPPPPRTGAVSPFAPPSGNTGLPTALGGSVPPAFSSAGEDKVFVARARSSRRRQTPAYRPPLVTPFRVGMLAILAAGALAVAFKSELQRIWDERIQGKVPKKSRPVEPQPPGETSGVSIAPDLPRVAVPPAAPPAPSAPTPVTPAPSPAPAEEAPVSAPPGDDSLAPPPPPAAGTGKAEIPQNEAGARDVLSRLVQATSAAEVRPFILDEARVGRGLETYFSSGQAVPVASHLLTLEQARPAANGRTVWLFRVITDNVPKGFPAGVEATPEGLKVDWEIFTQCRDSSLKRFVGEPAAAPALFFVALRKEHIFDDVLPAAEQSKYLAFALTSPALEDPPLIAFIRTGTPLAARAEKLYEFNNLYSPVVELTHRDGKIEITGIIRENWRNFSGPGISRSK